MATEELQSLTNELQISDKKSLSSTIASLEKFMEATSQQLEEAIEVQYDPISVVMKDTNDVYGKAKESLAHLVAINGNLKKEVDAKIVSTEEVQRALMNKMLKSESMISVLHQLCQCHELIEQSSDTSSLLEQAQKLREARNVLRSLIDTNSSNRITDVLQDELDGRVFDILREVSNWDTHFKLTPCSLTYSNDTRKDVSDKCRILEILETEEVKNLAESLSTEFNTKLLIPMIDQNLKCKVIENHQHYIRLVEKSNKPLISVLDDVLTLLLIVDDRIVPESPAFRNVFWSGVYQVTIEKLKVDCIEKCIPNNLEDLKMFAEEVIPVVKEFEEHLNGRELFPNFENSLTQHTENYYLLFSNKYKHKYYQAARNILLSQNEDTVLVSSVLDGSDKIEAEVDPCKDPCSPLTLKYPEIEKLLRIPEFKVTSRVAKLSDIVVQILREATSEHLPHPAKIFLCHVARTVAELFQIPSFDPFDAADHPKRAAQKFCDSWFLAHRIVWTSIELKSSLPSDVTFIDLVYHLRTAGAALLQSSSNSLLSKVQTLLSQTEGLGARDRDNQAMILEMAFVQIVALLNQHTGAWREVLPPPEYARLLNLALNSTLEFIMKETFRLEDISAKHSSCLNNNFRLMSEQLEKIRADTPCLDATSVGTRFRLLAAIMDDSLVKIVDDWESGVLPEFFKASEIVHLARAIFQNTEKNAALWCRIKGDII